MPDDSAPQVVAVARDAQHRVSKPVTDRIRLLPGVGVEGDAHASVVVQHLSRVTADPTQPNLRQVHLIHSELHDELRERGFDVGPGVMGENVLTRGVDLLGLPRGALVRLGADAVVEITGLRNPCRQLNGLQRGLMKAVLGRDEQGNLVRKPGVMAVVVSGGVVAPGDPVRVQLPATPHEALRPV